MSKSWDAFKNTTPQLLDGGMVVWRGLFTPKELDALEQQCDALVLEEAKLNSYGVHPIRATKVAWVHRTAETEDLYHRMEAIVLRLNAEHFRADLSGLSTMQYAVYRQAESGHFDWAEPGDEVHTLIDSRERQVGTYLLERRMYETMPVWETPRISRLRRFDNALMHLRYRAKR